ADNGDVTWTRVPLDGLLFYRWEKFRLGGGVTYHMSPKLHGSGAASGLDVTVDNALGGATQGDMLLKTLNMRLRCTPLHHKNSNGSAKGDSAGITIGYAF